MHSSCRKRELLFNLNHNDLKQRDGQNGIATTRQRDEGEGLRMDESCPTPSETRCRGTHPGAVKRSTCGRKYFGLDDKKRW
jgi:hypothetical protein